MKNLKFVVFRSELVGNVWSEWEAIGAFPDQVTARSYATERKKHDWCERKYRIEEIPVGVYCP